MDQLSKAIGEFLTELTDLGAQMPILLVSVAINGSMFYCRYRLNAEGSCDCDSLAENIEGSGFALPINMMFIDASGEAYRAVIAPDGKPQLLH